MHERGSFVEETGRWLLHTDFPFYEEDIFELRHLTREEMYQML